MKEFLRGYAQLRVTVPSYVGVGYSLGAGLSLGMKKKRPFADYPQNSHRSLNRELAPDLSDYATS